MLLIKLFLDINLNLWDNIVWVSLWVSKFVNFVFDLVLNIVFKFRNICFFGKVKVLRFLLLII